MGQRSKKKRSMPEPSNGCGAYWGIWVEKEMMIEAELGRAAEVQKGLLPKSRAVLRGYEVAGGFK